MPASPGKGGSRTFQQIKRQYEVEKELANRLRTASREVRRSLYVSLYDELFSRLPDHPMLNESADVAAARVAAQMRFLRRFLRSDRVLLEVGPGKCELLIEAAGYVRKAYGVDVARELTAGAGGSNNFELIISDGCTIPLPEASVDVAYSHQLMEHLHPDDALEQLENIWRALVPGGVYVCLTPNRLAGPFDISKYFDTVATGFHLKEYTNTELSALFRQVGFSRVSAYGALRGRYFEFALGLVTACERALSALPYRVRKPLAGRLPLRAVLGIQLVATK